MRDGWRRFAGNRAALAGLAVVAALAAAALAAPWLPLADPYATALSDRLLPPGPGRWLGTDHLGRDLLARLLWGLRASLGVALLGTALAALTGSAVGLVAGYGGRRLDAALMRSVDLLMAFPYMVLALGVVAVLGPGLRNAMVAVAVVNVPFFARTIRGETVRLKAREFVAAARLAGLSPAGVLWSEILPNALPAALIAASSTLGWMVLETAGLSFLGLGAQPPRADLGSMLADGRRLLTVAPHVAFLPGALVFALALSVQLVGDGLRDWLDPRALSPVRDPEEAPAAEAASARRPASGSRRRALIEVRDLSVRFSRTPAVERLSFRVLPGEAVGILGESGSGKSTAALALLGLLPPAARVSGEVLYQGRNLLESYRLDAVRGTHIGYVAQDPARSLDPLYPVGDQILEAIQRVELAPAAARRQVLELLRKVRLPAPEEAARAYPHQLSGGQRQRAAIAMALANGPRLLIADEPTTALDPTTQAQILDLLRELRRETRMALLLITHDLGVLSQVCDRALVLRHGRLVEEGALASLLKRPRQPYTRALVTAAPRLEEAP